MTPTMCSPTSAAADDTVVRAVRLEEKRLADDQSTELPATSGTPEIDGGENRVDNGLLLRSDVHTMFDGGYLAVDPSYRLRVSPRLRDEFGNGEQFYAQAGRVIALPDRKVDRPHREFVEWHLDEVFKAS
jgi:predicted restriction endonuclease